MKKVLATVAAASIVAAGAPAFAADADVSGEVRVRYQENNNAGGVKDAATQATTQRTRVNVSAQVDDQTTAVISLQDTRTWGSEAGVSTTGTEGDGTNGDQAVDVSKAYLNIKGALGPVDLKIGRQALVYGKQRMLGGFEWSDNATRWDAIKLTYGSEVVDVDVIKATATENANGSDSVLSGVYATVKTIPTSKLDVYHLILSATDDFEIASTGVRVAGKAAGADWDVEYISQGGDVDKTTSHEGSLLAVAAGYTIEPANNLRVGVDYSVGSGQSAGATDSEAFITYAATNHPLYGLHDNIMGGGEGNRGSNLTATGVNVTLPNLAGVKLKAETWAFTTTEDVGGEDDYGTEINVQATYGLTDKVKLHAYHVIFTPGDLSGANDEDASTTVVQLHAKF